MQTNGSHVARERPDLAGSDASAPSPTAGGDVDTYVSCAFRLATLDAVMAAHATDYGTGESDAGDDAVTNVTKRGEFTTTCADVQSRPLPARVAREPVQTSHAVTESVISVSSAVMTETSAAASLPASAAKAAKAKAPRAKPTHPPTNEMVHGAIKGLKERGGSSLIAIKKYIAANYKVDVEKLAPFIKKALKTGVTSGALVQTKGKGASGSFKLPSAAAKPAKKVVKTPKKKPATAKPAAKKTPKKAAAKKTTDKKKTAKSPAKAKKPAKAKTTKAKKAKSPAKKPRAPKPKKSPAKKPAAKKTAAKK